MKNKNFYRRAIQVAWPPVLESFFIALVGIIDAYMASSIGNSAAAVVGLTTQPRFIALSIFFAISIATSTLVARRLGGEDKGGANKILVAAITMGLVLTAVISTLVVYFSDNMSRLAGSNSDTHTDVLNYSRIIMGGTLFSAVNMAISATQRGPGNTRATFTANLVPSTVNILFNCCLIGGSFGFPKVEVSGTVLATVLGTVVSSIMCIRLLFRKDRFVRIKYTSKKKIKPTAEVSTSIVKPGTNLFVESVAMRIGLPTTALMAAGLGTDVFTAHNAGMNLFSICFVFADGMQVAVVALTRSSPGAGKRENAKVYGKARQRIGLMISLVLFLVLLLFGKGIFHSFFDKLSAIETGKVVARFIIVTVLLQTSQIIYGGRLESAGDVRYILISSVVSATITRTVVTYILVSVFEMGAVGIWLKTLSDQFSRYMFNSIRSRQGKWVNIKI